MRSARRLEAGLENKKSDCTGSSGELMPCKAFACLHAGLSKLPSHLLFYPVVCRVIELATVEPQISLHEQNSFTPASGKTFSFSCIHILSPLVLMRVDLDTSNHIC